MIADEICNSLLIANKDLFLNVISNNFLNFSPLVLNKGTDKERLIFRPKKFTKACQKYILDNYLAKLKCSNSVYSYKRKTSIVSNAKAHLGNKYFLHLDIKHYFNRMNWNIFNRVVFKNFNDSELSEILKRKEDNEFLKNILTFKGYIVQGSITSPYISNLYLIELDNYIHDVILSMVKNGVYTRYSDDIYISSSSFIPHNIIELIKSKLSEYELKLNYSKIQYKRLKNSVKVTGITILPNKRVTVSTEYKKSLKNQIYLCLKNKGKNINFEELLGKISYLKNVDPIYFEYLQKKYSVDGVDAVSCLKKLKNNL